MTIKLQGQSATDVWLNGVRLILENGTVVSPRGLNCKELLNAHTTVSMKYPIMDVPVRKLGYKFMYAEAYFILSGGSLVEDIAPYSRRISDYSDDGFTFAGAYGPKVVSQIDYVINTLVKDPFSRQAVLTIWRENPGPSKDIPCTISVQFIIRENQLHLIDTMRSSDMWLGWPYDTFNFSMIAVYVILEYYRLTGVELELGLLGMNLGSLHLYESEWAKAEDCLLYRPSTIPRLAIDPVAQFGTADKLMEFLHDMRDKGGSNE